MKVIYGPLIIILLFGACTLGFEPRENSSPPSSPVNPIVTPSANHNQESLPASTSLPTDSLLFLSPSAPNTAQPSVNCALGFGLKVETVAILMDYQYLPGIVTSASSNMSEDFFRELPGWTRVLSAPSLDALLKKAERAAYNGVPYEALGYGVETSESTPNEEWNDMVGSTQKAKEIADQFGKLLIVGPGFRLMSENKEDYAPMAALTDIWMIQTQRLQAFPPGPIYRERVKQIIDLIRSSNPEISIWAQITFLPDRDLDAEEWLAYHNSISDLVDATHIGVYNWNSVDSNKLITSIKRIYSSICGGEG